MADATQVEHWLPVVGYEGHYEVSDHGRVRSLPRKILRRDGVIQPIRGRVLKPGGGKGHQHVNLALNGVHDSLWIHRLVLEAFVGPAPAGKVCCHWDDDPTNNHVGNLRWATKGDNTRDAVRNGIHHYASRTHCPRRHPFGSHNLMVLTENGRTYRRCRACDRARRLVRQRARAGQAVAEEVDMQALSDLMYAEVMATHGAPRPQSKGSLSYPAVLPRIAG